MPTTKKTFFEDFKKIQEELTTLKIDQKVDYTTKAGVKVKYEYLSFPKLWESIKDILSKNNFVVNHFIEVEEGQEILITKASHAEGGDIVSKIMLPKEQNPQQKGSAITYFRRYNIMAIFNIVIEGEDDDGQLASQGYQGAERPITEKQLNWIKQLCEQKNVDIEAYQNQIGKKFEELYSTEASAIIDKLKSM